VSHRLRLQRSAPLASVIASASRYLLNRIPSSSPQSKWEPSQAPKLSSRPSESPAAKVGEAGIRAMRKRHAVSLSMHPRKNG
jgi:hypothetical protein